MGSKKDEDLKSAPMTFIRMSFEAISATRAGRKGASRQAIANYIKANFEVKSEGASFNSALRRALKDGIDRGVIEEGSSIARFKITDLGRRERKSRTGVKFDIEEEEEEERRRKKAKKAKAKKAAAKKKKASKKETKTKKKLTARQKAAAKKKKEKEKKEAAKKKAASKKRGRGRPKGSTSKRRTRSSS